MKIIKIGAIVILLFIVIILFFMLILPTDSLDVCLDSGWCEEGLTVNINNSKIIVDKKNCIDNNGNWIEDKHICHFKY